MNAQNLFGYPTSKGTTLKRAGFTRWLSHGNALNSIRKNYQALLTDMENTVSTGESSGLAGPTAAGLLKHLQRFGVFCTIHFMCDVLNTIEKLNLCLQERDIDLAGIETYVQSTLQDLKKLKRKPDGPFCRKLGEKARELGINAPVDGTDKSFVDDARSFLELLIDNISERLEQQSIVTKLSILDLRKASNSSLQFYGISEAVELAVFLHR
ncbi:hypothetical protein JTE90_018178 [Oedothorax gibbosus]|uniref:Uncharacterized protein n=1 Tax=Oedothorax gibbosus TaxID=931172 RepID=A0AAV6U9P8_9ARAC|nr:hypothetical protein JTE90_018178 [Oedothorax gibbosus]